MSKYLGKQKTNEIKAVYSDGEVPLRGSGKHLLRTKTNTPLLANELQTKMK